MIDGTLAESKAAIDEEMAVLLDNLLTVAKVSVISGGDWPQFEKQVLSHLRQNSLKRLSVLPTCGTKFFRYSKGWKELCAENFTVEKKKLIIKQLTEVVGKSGFEAKKTWGDQIEDRGSQVTHSALGQSAPLAEKKKWNPYFVKRKINKKHWIEP